MSNRFTTKHRAAELVTGEDLIRRTRAAARMALRGENWSAEDRADCAAELVCLVWSRAVEAGTVTSAPVTRRMSSVHGGERVTYTSKSQPKSKDRTPDAPGHASAIPADLCSFDFLVKRAADIRRSWEAARERDRVEALNAPVTFDPFIAAPADETGGTPWGARRKALELGRELGVIDRRVAPGPVWTFLYAVSRAVVSPDDRNNVSGGLDRETVAAELELDRETVKKHIQRALARIPATADTHPRAAWAEALHVPTGGVALKPSRSRTLSADMGTRHAGPRERLAPADHAPITVRRGTTRVATAWAKHERHRPAWTRDLAPATGARLAAAARIRQDRAARKVTGDPTNAPQLTGK